MNDIEKCNSWGDFIWLTFRGWIFLVLAFLAISVFFNMLYYYSNENDKSNLNDIRYCPNCGVDLIKRGVCCVEKK